MNGELDRAREVVGEAWCRGRSLSEAIVAKCSTLEQMANSAFDKVEEIKKMLAVAADRDRDLCAEVDRYDAMNTRLRKILDAAGEPHVVPYPLPKIGEAVDPYEDSLRAGGRVRPLDERVASLVERLRHVERRCVDLMHSAEMACEEPCGSCAGCHLASERAEEGAL